VTFLFFNAQSPTSIQLADQAKMPMIAEMDVKMTTQAEMAFKCTSRSSKVAPIES